MPDLSSFCGGPLRSLNRHFSCLSVFLLFHTRVTSRVLRGGSVFGLQFTSIAGQLTSMTEHGLPTYQTDPLYESYFNTHTILKNTSHYAINLFLCNYANFFVVLDSLITRPVNWPCAPQMGPSCHLPPPPSPCSSLSQKHNSVRGMLKLEVKQASPLRKYKIFSWPSSRLFFWNLKVFFY